MLEAMGKSHQWGRGGVVLVGVMLFVVVGFRFWVWFWGVDGARVI